MSTAKERDEVIRLLRCDVLRHIVTLKMLMLYGASIELRLARDGDGWALLTMLPARASEFDAHAYPDAELVVLVDGNSASLKSDLLERLPAGRLVVKTYDESTRRFVVDRLDGRLACSFRSFTAAPGTPPAPAPPIVAGSSALDPEVAGILSANGYPAPELARLFAMGARWFGVRDRGRFACAGFVFPNFDAVWEIGGVFTEPGHRRRGLARMVVASALSHLAAQGLVARYQVRSDNVASAGLAEACGLREFLRLDHYVAAKSWGPPGGQSGDSPMTRPTAAP